MSFIPLTHPKDQAREVTVMVDPNLLSRIFFVAIGNPIDCLHEVDCRWVFPANPSPNQLSRVPLPASELEDWNDASVRWGNVWLKRCGHCLPSEPKLKVVVAR